MGNANSENLLGKDVVNSILKIGNMLRQAHREAAGDLAQKDTGLRKRVEKPHRFTGPDVCAFIVGVPSSKDKVSLSSHETSGVRSSEEAAKSPTVIVG